MNNMVFPSYMNTSNNEQFIDLSVYDMGSPTNAFGVYSSERSQGKPSLNLGRTGYRSDASYFIWKGQYYVRIVASDINKGLQNMSINLSRAYTNVTELFLNETEVFFAACGLATP